MSALAIPTGSPVFLITHEFYPKRGGIATFAEEMARATAALGCPIEVWAQDAPAGAVKTGWLFPVRRMPLKGTHDWWDQFQLARQLFRERARLKHAVVYLAEPGPMLTMMLLQFFPAFRPARLMLTFHGSEILKFSRSPLRRWLAGRLIARADRVSTLTQFVRDLLVAHFPQAAGKVCLTPGAIRSDFSVVTSEPGRKSDRIVVLTVGRLHPRKGQLLTLEALQLLPPDVRNRVEYWIVGTAAKGDYESRLRKAALKCPELAVRFFGDVPDAELAVLYDRADIFAMTSVTLKQSIEGFGLAYLEASAHGLPVVAHDVGGVAEAVIDNVTGLLVPPERPAQLAAAFEKLIHDAALRQRLGQAGRQRAARTSWRDSAAVLFEAAT